LCFAQRRRDAGFRRRLTSCSLWRRWLAKTRRSPRSKVDLAVLVFAILAFLARDNRVAAEGRARFSRCSRRGRGGSGWGPQMHTDSHGWLSPGRVVGYSPQGRRSLGTLCVSRQGLPGWSSFGSGFSSELERRPLLVHTTGSDSISRVPTYPSQDQEPLRVSPSSGPVVETGGWSKLAWTQVPRRRTPLHVTGKTGISLGFTASHRQVVPHVLHLCVSLCICGSKAVEKSPRLGPCSPGHGRVFEVAGSKFQELGSMPPHFTLQTSHLKFHKITPYGVTTNWGELGTTTVFLERRQPERWAEPTLHG
jgi:hypothetical protein